MIAEKVFEMYSGPPNSILVDFNIFQILILFGAFSFMLFLFLFLGLVTNRESWFWFWMRFGGNVAIAEFDDSGKTVFKKEKPIGQGVTKGTTPRDYNVTPRNLSLELNPFIKEETDRRFLEIRNAYLEAHKEEAEKDKTQIIELPDKTNVYNSIRAEVETEFEQIHDTLEVASDINRFKAFTWGTRTPFFVRYSGKAVNVNPLTATVITGGRYARVQDLKTFFNKMITPSQIKYIATLSEMIGAKQLKEENPWTTIIVIGVIFVTLLLLVFWGLPAMGVRLF